ncbi:MAG: OmpA/MotB domain protein, partial [Proteobacteria bacterium]|nr:OmpA/MotB domain protein [Pseudomonadota bacterium]
ARARLTQLQSDPQLATRAAVEISDAEAAVVAAEKSRKDKDLVNHLVLIADRKVDIAGARARARLYEDQRKGLSEQSATARLDSRTREADDLRRQLAELNAKETDRGMVVTLGDVLFDTGKSDLKGGAVGNLAGVLNKYQDRTVIIEGHTDSVGSDDYNYGLSNRRANAVKSFLVSQGISAGRIDASGKGEGYPVADNGSPAGRQQNRRVEVIISNTGVSSP